METEKKGMVNENYTIRNTGKEMTTEMRDHKIHKLQLNLEGGQSGASPPRNLCYVAPLKVNALITYREPRNPQQSSCVSNDGVCFATTSQKHRLKKPMPKDYHL